MIKKFWQYFEEITGSALLVAMCGVTTLQALYPFGIEGTTAWLRAIADAWGISQSAFEAAVAPRAERARRALAPHRQVLSGKRISLFPDSLLEVPLARFLGEECGMHLVEVGVPYLDQQLLAPRLPADTRLCEGQDVDRQLERLRADRPDLTVCGLGLANPLEAEGLRTKWSIELVFTPIHGFEQVADLAELFTRPLARQQRLVV